MKASPFLVFAVAFAAAIHSTNAQVFEGGVPLAQAAVTEAWVHRYGGNMVGGANDQAAKVVRDMAGDVIVTGTSGSGYDYYTAKYAAANGALLWEKRFNGPEYDSSPCLALGPNGMIAVSGSSSGDFATVVYREVLPAVSIDLIPTGVRLRFTGVPGRSYYLERAPALTNPWSTINTQIAPASGLLEYLDTLPPPGSGFYRIVQP